MFVRLTVVNNVHSFPRQFMPELMYSFLGTRDNEKGFGIKFHVQPYFYSSDSGFLTTSVLIGKKIV